MNITNKGKKWEILNSLWIIWSFTLVLACVGFFWIGGRTGQRKWIISGMIYLLVNLALFLVAPLALDTNNVLFNIFFVIIFIGFFAAIIQSFMSRKEYLIRLEAVLDLENATREAYRNKLRQDYFGDSGMPVHQVVSVNNTAAAPSVQQAAPSMPKIDLNTATEQELSKLPGVGAALAKRAVEARAQAGGFTSVADFNQQLGLMPHFAVQIENMAYVEPPIPPAPPTENAGRVIDI